MNIFSFKHSTTALLLLIAFTLSAWSILLSHHAHYANINQSHQPDAYMENIEATVLNKQGLPTLKIISPKMTHYAENDAMYITHPIVTIYRQSPEPWYINSDSAQTTHGIDQIIFSHHVIIHHLMDIANPNTTMETESLTIFPNKQEAHTDNAVKIVQPDTTIRAIGMHANLNDGTVKLLSEAKGDYVPSS